MKLYHGSEKIIDSPSLERGYKRNDFGRGFYCTKDEQAARSWACSDSATGYVSRYEFSTAGLKTLNLCDGKNNVLNWMALLLKYREFDMKSSLTLERGQYILDNFLPNTEGIDVINGLRCDNSNFFFTKQFLNNAISLRTYETLLKQPKSNGQIVLISEKAMRKIHFVKAETVLWQEYFSQSVEKDLELRDQYQQEKAKDKVSKDVFLIDIIKQGWTNDVNGLSAMLYR